MRRLKSKRYLIAAVLGVGGFLAAFFMVYAGVVQVSREVPTDVTFVATEVIADENLVLYKDKDLTEELTEIQMVLPRFQAPLDKLAGQMQAWTSVTIWAKNASQVPLTLIDYCCPEVHDVASGGHVGWLHVHPGCVPTVNN